MPRKIMQKANPIQQRLIEIGRCYKGGPKGSSNKGRYAGGDDYASPYFRFEPSDRLKFQPAANNEFKTLFDELKAAWEELIGQGSIKIRFPHSTIEENFDWTNKVTKEIGNTTKTFRECDGTTCTKWVESAPHPTDRGRTIPVFKRGQKPCSATSGGECPESCQPKGMLKFMVPDLYAGGIILFPLNSPVDIAAIAGYLEPYRNLDLSAVPFSLFRMEAAVSWEEKGETKTKKNWGLHLELDPTVSRLMLQGSERRYMAQIEQGDFTSVRSLPPAPTKALPASKAKDELFPLKKSEDGIIFENRLQKAIIKRSLDDINRALSEARDLVHAGLYHPGSHSWIDQEEHRAMETLMNNGGALPDIARATVNDAISKAMSTLKWTRKQGSDYLKKTYDGKATRDDLTFAELTHFADYLEEIAAQSQTLEIAAIAPETMEGI